MKIFKYAWLIAFFLFNKAAYSQNHTSHQISGNIINETGEEIAFATVILLQNNESIIKSGISDENGRYKLTDIETGTYTLRIDHVEYKTYKSGEITLNSEEKILLKDIVLNPTATSLDEIVLTHKKALIEVKADKIVFNVASSPSASGTNGLDLLKKSPGVTLGIDNSISVLGKSNVQIYLNGIPSQLEGNDLTNFLQSLSSDLIDSIEVISNPSSKYDAEGTGGVINIKLKKSVATGFNGNISSSFTKGEEYKTNSNIALNYGSKKVKASLDFTQTYDNELEFFIDDSKQQNNALLLLNSKENKILRGYNIGVALDYQPNEKNYLNLNIRSILNNFDTDLNSITNIYQLEPPEFSEILLSNSLVDGNSQNIIGSLNHLWNTNETTTLTSNVSFGNYNSESSTFQPNTYLEPDNLTILRTDDTSFDADTEINLWSAKVDLDKEWKKTSLSTGLKYTQIKTKNQFAFFNVINNVPEFDPTKSNNFNYTENVAAIYANLQQLLNSKMTLNIGLRVEHTNSRGELLSNIDIDNKDVTRNYTDFFPNLSFIYDTENNHVWSLNIGRRITRPNYQDLNPFETPLSQLVVWKGNPFLNPNYIMNYQVSYSFKQQLVITTAYSHTIDFFARIVEIVNDINTQIIPRNMDSSNNYGISLSYPFTITDFWEVVNFGNFSYQTFDGEIGQTIIDIETTLWDFQIQSIFKLPQDLLIDLTYFQRSDWIWRGSVDIEGRGGLNFGIRKEFFNNKLQVRVTGANVFGRQRDYPYQSEYGGIILSGTYRDDSQRFGLGATYKFGNNKLKERKKIDSGLEDELNRIQD